MQIVFDFRAAPEREQHLANEQRLQQLVDGFRTALGHELPNSLVVIQGLARSLEEEVVEDSADEVRRIVSVSRRLDRLVRRLAELAKLTRPDVEARRLDLEEHLEEAIALVRVRFRERNIRINTDLRQCFAWLDPRSLDLVIAELTANAVQSNSIERVAFEVGCQPTESGGEFWIRDTGSGIATNLENVCEPFSARHSDEERLGIGLFCVHQVIARWRGLLRIETVPNEGTEVMVSLPSSPLGTDPGQVVVPTFTDRIE